MTEATPAANLSQLIPSEQTSLFETQQQSQQQLLVLKSQVNDIGGVFALFQDETMSFLRSSMGRISNTHYKTVRERKMLEGELEKSRAVQATMRNEVIQLKDMINEAMIEYSKDLRQKQETIQLLQEQLERYRGHQKQFDSQSHLAIAQPEEIKIQEPRPTNRDQELEIIQEESSHATYSSATSLREFREEEERESREEEEREMSEEVSIIPESHFKPDETQEVSLPDCMQDLGTSQQSKKAKNFIQKFRQNIVDSKCQQTTQNNKQNSSRHSKTHQMLTYQGEPLRELQSNSNQPIRCVTNYLKIKIPQSQPNFTKTIYLNTQGQDSFEGSQIDELSKVSGIEQESQIHQIRKLETPTSLFKKKSSQLLTHHRLKTEPALQQNCFQSKPASLKQDRRSGERTQSECKSVKKSRSKEKIRVTSRMVDENSYQAKRNHASNSAKAVVYLGGKGQFRKFLLELKMAFRKYHINQISELYGCRVRCGRGQFLLKNGLTYQGEVRDGMRQGRGSVLLNGISIYEGEWCRDRLQGEGYIKSMRYMSISCPEAFNEASFCGNISENRLQGIGTIFLNSREKIVTKFAGGCPIGELTYYNLNEIQFGVWPSQ